jgi:hypothetical protein
MSQTPEAKILEEMYGVKPDMEGGLAILQNAKRGSRQVQYFVKTDGWVTIGPARSTNGPEYLAYSEERHYKPLPYSFGLEVAGNGTMQSSEPRNTHKQFQEFINNGGLTARDERGEYNHKPGEYIMCKEQVVALGLHRLESVRKMREDILDVIDYTCPQGCIDGRGNKRLFAGTDARDQHIQSVHKESVATEALSRAVQAAITGSNAGIDPTTIAAIVAATVQALRPVEQSAIAGVQLELDNEEEFEGDSLDGPPKRGRGRPRKYPILD